MHGAVASKGGNVFAEAEEADAASKVRRFGACTHTRPIARVPGGLPSVDVTDDVERDVDLASPQLRNGVKQEVDALRRND